MNWEIEDPRWTAFLLGELSPDEHAEAEELLRKKPQLQCDVESLKTVLEYLQTEFSQPALRALEPLRKEAVLQHKSHKTPRRLWFPTAAAALFAIGFGIAHYFSLPSSAPKSIQEADEHQDGEATLSSIYLNESETSDSGTSILEMPRGNLEFYDAPVAEANAPPPRCPPLHP